MQNIDMNDVQLGANLGRNKLMCIVIRNTVRFKNYLVLRLCMFSSVVEHFLTMSGILALSPRLKMIFTIVIKVRLSSYICIIIEIFQQI